MYQWKKIYGGIYTYGVGILGKLWPKVVQNLTFFVIFNQIHLIYAKTDHHTKFFGKIYCILKKLTFLDIY